MFPTEGLPEDVHLTMEQVLEAERAALAAIEDSQRRAEEILDAAREDIRVLNLRADGRIARLHHLCEQRIAATQSSGESPEETHGGLDSAEQALLAESLSRLVDALTRDSQGDESA